MTDCRKNKESLPSQIVRGTRDVMPRPRFFLLLSLLLFSLPLRAHTIDQVYLELTPGAQQLKGEFIIDAAYCLPQYRGDESQKAPDRDWLLSLDQDSYQTLRVEAERYLRATFRLMIDQRPLSYQVSFPDFQSSPPDFEPSLLNKPLLTIAIDADYQEMEGPLQVQWREPFGAYLIIYLPIQGEEGTKKYLQCNPHSALDLGWTIAGQKQAENKAPSAQQALSSSSRATGQSLWTFFLLGFEHILPKGWDHILFVVGLFLYAPQWRALMKQTVLFTIAHSVTLAATLLHFIVFPAQWVEILIALSILYIGIENLVGGPLGLRRLVLIFVFGLLHGMGFAAMLEAYLGGGSLLLPLVGFNLGVEAGQIAVLGFCFLLLLFWKGSFAVLQKTGSILISLVALYWVIERMG